MSAWNNAINREFIEGLIDKANSLKEDYTTNEREQFYKKLGRYLTDELLTTYDEDVLPE